MDVDIDQLSSERAAEGGGEVARLDADDDVPAVGTVVVDLEVCDVERSCVAIARGRIGVIAWTGVISGRVADVEELGRCDRNLVPRRGRARDRDRRSADRRLVGG